jgi:cobyric acid synthase
MGTYLHGLFDEPGVVQALLGPLKPSHDWPNLPSHAAWREQQFDALAGHLRACVDLATIRSWWAQSSA